MKPVTHFYHALDFSEVDDPALAAAGLGVNVKNVDEGQWRFLKRDLKKSGS